MLLWRIKSAIYAGIKAFCHPVLNVKGSLWSGERCRFCYAARILNRNDFKKVCPIASKHGQSLELSDSCDSCPYLGSAVFQTLSDDQKKFVKFQ